MAHSAVCQNVGPICAQKSKLALNEATLLNLYFTDSDIAYVIGVKKLANLRGQMFIILLFWYFAENIWHWCCIWCHKIWHATKKSKVERTLRLRAICLMGSVQSLGVEFQRPPIILLLCIRPPGKPHSSKCCQAYRTGKLKAELTMILMIYGDVCIRNKICGLPG